jgi:hypothetical protein
MKLRTLLSVGSVALIAAKFWVYRLYMAQLNNSIALQRCVVEVEQEQRVTGNLPRSVDCMSAAVSGRSRPARKQYHSRMQLPLDLTDVQPESLRDRAITGHFA